MAGTRVYAENKPGRLPAYAITEEILWEALRGVPQPLHLTLRSASDPDLAALEAAEFFVGSGFDRRRVALHGKRLRIVHVTSAGIDSYLPLDWLPPGAVFTNSSGIHAEKAGEFGLLALLMLNDGIPRHVTNQRAHRWHRQLNTPIRGKTVLVHGVGALGGAIAEKAKLLGLRVLGTRRSGAPHPHVDRMGTQADLPALLPQADFLVVSSPVTPETRGAIGAAEIALMRPEAGLVNVSRAAVVDYAALAEALRAGRLAGAVLDVFDPEPLPPEAPWWDVPNLVVVPHVSSDNPDDYVRRGVGLLGDNIRALAEGRPLRNVVDEARGY
jgi:phosphoglycerate dehydrogenase-like enzyme